MMNLRRFFYLISFLVLVSPTYHQVLYSCDRNAPCGCSFNPASVSRIVGGEGAGTGTWGWAVSISIDNGYLCGGSIISDSWIISAAHCFHQHESATITIYAGSNLQWAGSQSRVVSQLIMHPDYDESTYSNDIALLKLSTPLNMTDPNISSICMPLVSTATLASDEWPLINTTVVAVGWGRLSENGIIPENLQQVSLRAISSQAFSCSRVIHNTAIQFCAESPDGMKDTCQGDSGGPIMMFTADRQWVLVGLTSFGYGCAQPDYAGVYTRVAVYQSWIQSHTDGSRWVTPVDSDANSTFIFTHYLFFLLISMMSLLTCL